MGVVIVKVWVRIIIALCIVLVLGFSVWAFFFREKDEVKAYNKTAELIDYKESLGISEKLVDLNRMNYVGGKKENIISSSTENGKEIYRLRAICLGTDKIVGSGDSGVAYIYNSYYVTDGIVDEILEYYLPYTKSSKVNNKSLSNLKGNINSYIERLKSLNETLEELTLYQNHIDGTDSDIEGLVGRYNTLYLKYRETLNSSASVILSLIEYVDISVYSDNLYIDTTSALYDAFARALSVSTSVKQVLENDYTHDLHIISTKLEEVKAGTNIFNEEITEYDFLNSYNILFNKHKDVLNYVFSCKNLEKKQMAEGNYLSSIVLSAQQPVVNILNILGFVGA